MAAHSNNFIRVRLHFDYPPPAVVDCRMCWLLVDLNTCRVVADLESVIRQKFEFSRRSILSLFVEDCYLPHTESVYVVRDNDCLRVKVDCLAQGNGYSSCPDTKSENSRKRQRPTEDDGPGENGVNLEWKKKKRKKKSEESPERNSKQASEDEKNKKSGEKKKRKKAEEKVPPVSPKPAASIKKPPVKGTKKSQTVSSSDSSSSSGDEDEAPKKPSTQKPAPKKPDAQKAAPKKPDAQKAAPKTPSSTPAASKAPPTTKPNQTKSKCASSSSSDSDSSSDEVSAVKNNSLTSTTPKGRTTVPKKSDAPKPAPKIPSATPAASKAPSTTKPNQKKPHPASSSSDSDSSSDEDSAVKTKSLTSTTPKGRIGDNSKQQQALPALQLTNGAQKQAAKDKPSSSDSEEEIKLVIRRPLKQPEYALGSVSSWNGRGRGQPRHGGPGAGRGSNRDHSSNFEFSYNRAKEPSCLTDRLTNMSVVLENGAEAAPKRDYSSMPLLAAPPPPGQKIAFKLLELTENYTPEVSEYKEGKIVSFDPTTKQIELELLHASQAPIEPGKFDLVYQNADGSESVEYAVSRGSQVTERWDSLLEPRLIL
ncbi:coilin isoform X2 [Centropristis striata]|uniref:coilin isoform X2 n=1 Tax=Centropristis striata TaxID=184440 RepID=UPI0027DF37C2|nr:coilin isoform X2 [Centropristis striata]